MDYTYGQLFATDQGGSNSSQPRVVTCTVIAIVFGVGQNLFWKTLGDLCVVDLRVDRPRRSLQFLQQFGLLIDENRPVFRTVFGRQFWQRILRKEQKNIHTITQLWSKYLAKKIPSRTYSKPPLKNTKLYTKGRLKNLTQVSPSFAHGNSFSIYYFSIVYKSIIKFSSQIGQKIYIASKKN